MSITFRRPRHSTIVAYLALLVATSGTAYAATGGTFILGRANVETTASSLTNHGTAPALTLNARAGHPVLGVSNSVKIPHLNADLVDGQPAGVVHVYTATRDTYTFIAAAIPLGHTATLITKPLHAGKYFFDVTGRVDIQGAEDDTHCDIWFGSTWSGLGNAVEEFPASGQVLQAGIAFSGVATVPAGTPASVECSWNNFQSPQQTPTVYVYNLGVTAIPVSAVN